LRVISPDGMQMHLLRYVMLYCKEVADFESSNKMVRGVVWLYI
jgi:hypothetical protein